MPTTILMRLHVTCLAFILNASVLQSGDTLMALQYARARKIQMTPDHSMKLRNQARGFSVALTMILQIGTIFPLLPGPTCHTAVAQEQLTLVDQSSTRRLQIHALSDHIQAEDWLISVPENRRDNASRKIVVHYIRFPTANPSPLTPVFILPGGPGQAEHISDLRKDITTDRYCLMAEVKAWLPSRDVIIVNQRGVSGTPGGPALPVYWTAPAPPMRSAFSRKQYSPTLARGFKAGLRGAKDQGFDLRGYDILHLVDDIEAIRQAHEYPQIALRGASFGSQWTLAYHRRYASHVDRMLLFGVEPVDCGYDSPDGMWNVLARVEQQAQQSDNLSLPDIGLLNAVTEIIRRLERKPVQVRGRHPRRGFTADVTIGADDFRQYIARPLLNAHRHSRTSLGWWPKFVAEIYHEDYQYLASKIIDDRPETRRYGMLMTLVDHSLSISAQREQILLNEPARRWLGDINGMYTATRTVSPVPVISDDMRSLMTSETPVLMVHGTLDLATPIENTGFVQQQFVHSKLITVDGGTHAAAFHAAGADKNFLTYLTRFMQADSPPELFDALPDRITLPKLEFQPTSDPSLFELLTKDAN